MIPQFNSPPADAADPNAIAWNTGVGVANWQKYGIDLRDTLKLLRGVPVTTAGGTGPGATVQDAITALSLLSAKLDVMNGHLQSIAQSAALIAGTLGGSR